jgi:hypothetical protein
MRGATIRHMTLAVGLVLLLLTLRSQPAAAHSTNGSDATHYRTRLDGLAPPVAGLTATVDPRGEWIQVTNATGKTLIILRYAHPSRSSPVGHGCAVRRQGGKADPAESDHGLRSSASRARRETLRSSRPARLFSRWCTQRASPAPGSASRVAVDVVGVEFGLLGVDAGYRYDLGAWMEGGI